MQSSHRYLKALYCVNNRTDAGGLGCNDIPSRFEDFATSCFAPQLVGLSQHQPFCQTMELMLNPNATKLTADAVLNQFDLVLVSKRNTESLALMTVLYDFPATFMMFPKQLNVNTVVKKKSPDSATVKLRERLLSHELKADNAIYHAAEAELERKVAVLSGPQRARFEAVLSANLAVHDKCTVPCSGKRTCFFECAAKYFGTI
jgi:hypothetical protein